MKEGFISTKITGQTLASKNAVLRLCVYGQMPKENFNLKKPEKHQMENILMELWPK